MDSETGTYTASPVSNESVAIVEISDADTEKEELKGVEIRPMVSHNEVME